MADQADWSQGWLGEQHTSRHDTISRREITCVAIALATEILIVVVVIVLAKHLVQIDHFDRVYGISTGLNNHYCYLDLDQWHAVVWGCESAR